MTREEHLAWCKRRALQYIEHGDVDQAFTSMASDLSKHPELSNHPGIELGAALFFNGHLGTADKMRRFIEGFN